MSYREGLFRRADKLFSMKSRALGLALYLGIPEFRKA